jgi:hypothetical protein
MRVFLALSAKVRASANVGGALRALVLSFAALFMCLPLLAQSVSGRILGIVTDQSGGVLVGATVIVTDVERGAKRTIVTDASGQYVAAELPPGIYTVRVEAAGFKAAERPNIQLEVAKDVTIDISLQPGEVTQTVTVTQQVPLLDTSSSALGGTLSNQQINDLPLSGRNYQNLLQLRPAVVRYPGGGFSTTSTNGLRAEDNAYLIEGLLNSEPYSGQGIINGAGIVGDSATILPIDAIQEFNLIENPPAEYGWKPGAIVNVGLKSGTNGLHGTGYAFGRDDAMDARNFFNVAPNPKVTTLEQFGGTLGGPIIKDKLFFGSYEGQRYMLGNTFGVTTPISASSAILGTDPNNVIPDAVHELLAADVPISLVSQKISGCTVTGSFPTEVTTCNGKGFPTNTTDSTGISQGFPNNANTDNALGKVDYHVNDHHTISGTILVRVNLSGKHCFLMAPRLIQTLRTSRRRWRRSMLAAICFLTVPSLTHAQGAPPLLTNDTGTPGNGNWEINRGVMTVLRLHQDTFQVPQIDVNFGMGDRVQLTYEIPFVLQNSSGQPAQSGWSNMLVGLKWRFRLSAARDARLGCGDTKWSRRERDQIVIAGRDRKISRAVGLGFRSGLFRSLECSRGAHHRIHRGARRDAESVHRWRGLQRSRDGRASARHDV